MAFNFNGTNQYLSFATPASGEPMTLTIYGKSTSATVGQYAIVLFRPTAINVATLFGVVFAGASAGDPILSEKVGNNGSSGAIAVTGAGYSANSWHSATGVFISDSSRDAYLDGGAKGSNSTTITIDPIDIGKIGCVSKTDNVPISLFVGDMAEAAVWSAALTDAEIVSLAKGFSPRRIRPQSLVFYAPLLRNLQDLRQGLVLTAVNSPTVAAHPRVY